ncbi:MAG: ParB/RepB/Spo0J family partition protein [Acidobacteriota bacterium]
MKKVPALGRGMGALIPEKREDFREIEVERIRPNPYQPRTAFPEASLAELTASIRSNGVLQPVLVTPAGDGYQMVAGERRFRAAVAAGLRRIPALVRKVDAQQQRLLALVENLQREDLDPIEEAEGYQALVDFHSLSHEEISQRVGKDRSTVANSVRLLRLPAEVKNLIREGKLSAGHAKALLAIDGDGDIKRAARVIVERGLSVRQAERLAGQHGKKGKKGPKADPDPNTRAAQEALIRALQTKVEIRRSRRGGQIVIHFYSEDGLDKLYNLLVKGLKRAGSTQISGA